MFVLVVPVTENTFAATVPALIVVALMVVVVNVPETFASPLTKNATVAEAAFIERRSLTASITSVSVSNVTLPVLNETILLNVALPVTFMVLANVAAPVTVRVLENAAVFVTVKFC